MPRYNYKCKETNEVVEREFSMNEVKSSFEEDGKTYVRDYSSESKEKAIIIPLYMKSTSQVGIMRGNRKSPSGRKHFF